MNERAALHHQSGFVQANMALFKPITHSSCQSGFVQAGNIYGMTLCVYVCVYVCMCMHVCMYVCGFVPAKMALFARVAREETTGVAHHQLEGAFPDGEEGYPVLYAGAARGMAVQNIHPERSDAYIMSSAASSTTSMHCGEKWQTPKKHVCMYVCKSVTMQVERRRRHTNKIPGSPQAAHWGHMPWKVTWSSTSRRRKWRQAIRTSCHPSPRAATRINLALRDANTKQDEVRPCWRVRVCGQSF
jgi:hypothetical protein